MKEELLKLADRVEALSGPDREVDKLIAVVNGWCLHPSNRQRDDSAQSDTGYTCLDCGADSWGNTGPTGQKRSASLPAYTASLDAAMTLVPKTMSLVDLTLSWEPPEPEVFPACSITWYPAAVIHNGKDWHALTASGATPALALTAAALRALAKEK